MEQDRTHNTLDAPVAISHLKTIRFYESIDTNVIKELDYNTVINNLSSLTIIEALTEYVYLYFDIDDSKHLDQYESLINYMKDNNIAYLYGGYTNRQDYAQKYQIDYKPKAKKEFSVHVHTSLIIKLQDMKDLLKRDYNVTNSCIDSSVYNGTHNKLRHIYSNKIFKNIRTDTRAEIRNPSGFIISHDYPPYLFVQTDVQTNVQTDVAMSKEELKHFLEASNVCKFETKTQLQKTQASLQSDALFLNSIKSIFDDNKHPINKVSFYELYIHFWLNIYKSNKFFDFNDIESAYVYIIDTYNGGNYTNDSNTRFKVYDNNDDRISQMQGLLTSIKWFNENVATHTKLRIKLDKFDDKALLFDINRDETIDCNEKTAQALSRIFVWCASDNGDIGYIKTYNQKGKIVLYIDKVENCLQMLVHHGWENLIKDEKHSYAWDKINQFRYYKPLGFNETFTGFTQLPKDNSQNVLVSAWWKYYLQLVNEVLCYDQDKEKKLQKQVYLHSWIANIIQNKTRNSKMLIFIGQQGVGKSTFSELLQSMLGETNYSTGPIDVFNNKFNEELYNKLLYVINESPSYDEKNKLEEKMKNYITENVIRIEKKGKPVLNCENRVNYILSTNSALPIKRDYGDRRYIQFDVQWTLKDKKEDWFNKYYQLYEGSTNLCIQHALNYYNTYEIDKDILRTFKDSINEQVDVLTCDDNMKMFLAYYQKQFKDEPITSAKIQEIYNDIGLTYSNIQRYLTSFKSTQGIYKKIQLYCNSTRKRQGGKEYRIYTVKQELKDEIDKLSQQIEDYNL